jgi:uncharacterized protein YjiS (DUF1127 family)
MRDTLLCAWGGVERAWSAARRRQRRAKAFREGLLQLRAMDDRELRDVGMSRGDLPRLERREILAAPFHDATICEPLAAGYRSWEPVTSDRNALVSDTAHRKVPKRATAVHVASALAAALITWTLLWAVVGLADPAFSIAHSRVSALARDYARIDSRAKPGRFSQAASGRPLHVAWQRQPLQPDHPGHAARS